MVLSVRIEPPRDSHLFSIGFNRIQSDQINGLGGVNEGALIQEFLDGTEYVVDTVSRGGVHRVCAIWEYDKRSVNK